MHSGGNPKPLLNGKTIDLAFVLRNNSGGRGHVETVKVSPKFQVVIPRKIRESLHIRPGQRIQVLLYEGRVEFIPLRRMKEMRGFLRGIDTTVEREQDRL